MPYDILFRDANGPRAPSPLSSAYYACRLTLAIDFYGRPISARHLRDNSFYTGFQHGRHAQRWIRYEGHEDITAMLHAIFTRIGLPCYFPHEIESGTRAVQFLAAHTSDSARNLHIAARASGCCARSRLY